MADMLRQGKLDSFTIVNNKLLESELLTEHEKMVYIIIRKYLNQEKQVAFPGMATISREARISKSQVIRSIKGLEEKGLLTVKRETTKYNERKTNHYYFNDFSDLWDAKTVDDLKKIAEEKRKPLTEDEIIEKVMQIDKSKRERLYYQLAKEFDKEKEPTSEPAKVTDVSTSSQYNLYKYITKPKKSQGTEQYTLEQIKQLLGYDIMVHDNPYHEKDIQAVMYLLYTAMNTTKETIRIAGEDKPSEVVIGKLKKLTHESIMYAIEKFSAQTGRVNNPTSYMLTILYNAPEQFTLDIQNKVSYDMAHQDWNREDTDLSKG